MSVFAGIIVGVGQVDDEDKVLPHWCDMGTCGMSADMARRLADDLLRSANEIDPLVEEEEPS